MNWEHAYDIRPSVNIRGEKVYDIYKKGTEECIWVDIPVADIDQFLKDMVSISNRAINEQMDSLFSEDKTETPKDNKPLEVEYTRSRGFPYPWSTDDK